MHRTLVQQYLPVYTATCRAQWALLGVLVALRACARRLDACYCQRDTAAVVAARARVQIERPIMGTTALQAGASIAGNALPRLVQRRHQGASKPSTYTKPLLPSAWTKHQQTRLACASKASVAAGLSMQSWPRRDASCALRLYVLAHGATDKVNTCACATQPLLLLFCKRRTCKRVTLTQPCQHQLRQLLGLFTCNPAECTTV